MFVDIKNRLANGEEYLIWDCIVCNLEADINFAEQETVSLELLD